MATTLTYTAGDLATEALRECRVVSIDRPASADEMDVAIKRLNFMLKAWQNRAVSIWKLVNGSITITDATQSYPIASRPLTLETVNKKEPGGTEIWMYEMSRDEYHELPNKDSTGDPTQYYYHLGRDAGTLFVWPVMTTGTGTIEWSGRSEVEDVTATTDAIDVPGEWYEAVLYGLAWRLDGAFGVKDPDIRGMAEGALRDAMGADVDGSIFFEPDYDA